MTPRYAGTAPPIVRVVGVVIAWAVLVTALHVAVNHRVSLTRAAGARAVEVGGLPVT